MKAAVTAAGIAVPRCTAVDSAGQVVAFAGTVDGPVVAKPRTGAASAGTLILDSGADHAAALAGLDLTGYEAEEYVEGPIWHVDGLRHQGKDIVALGSRYMDTCYGFAQGHWLGSVVQGGPAARRMTEFAARCLDAFGLTDGPYHLEAVEHADGPVFLEVGARLGGGEIPFTMRDVYGVDLMADWIRIALGGPPLSAPVADAGTEHAGFLMLPEPVGRTLVSRPCLLGRIPHLYAAQLPEPGHTFTGAGGYDEILGRFRYRGPSAEAVEQAVRRTVVEYRYELKAGEEPG